MSDAENMTEAESDRAEKILREAELRDACGYTVAAQPCAACRHVLRYTGICRKHMFPVSIERGHCRDFSFAGRFANK